MSGFRRFEAKDCHDTHGLGCFEWVPRLVLGARKCLGSRFKYAMSLTGVLLAALQRGDRLTGFAPERASAKRHFGGSGAGTPGMALSSEIHGAAERSHS